jgi:SAM-dependent methyltransferase
MDIELLDALRAVPWQAIGCAVDLGCGTDRIEAWLRTNGVSSIDGVDLTPEMLAVTGHDNTAVGDQSLAANKIGDSNVALRSGAGGNSLPARTTSTSPTRATPESQR